MNVQTSYEAIEVNDPEPKPNKATEEEYQGRPISRNATQTRSKSKEAKQASPMKKQKEEVIAPYNPVVTKQR
eukprot:CAMPEP_0116875080 /NCGR_PEP_ID=MMETSP0463-20121206/6860_1 /TAXON_ID=181622 /ORGANISM="Strombidinopsis sp, Strain SopsisLIS2011" /LENGTH=71 /DNA_ID=CAMNT_0004520003 /DNA_START=555 /DNA_END=770 /DNA_ORIENTATION=+